MVEVDMTQAGRDLNPGIDLWEIVTANEAKSQGGDKMIKLKFERVSEAKDKVFDNIMLEGGGWDIGKGKMAAFVPADFKGNIDLLTWVGKQLWVATGVEAWNGKDRLKVMIDELKFKGYQPAEDVPPGKELPALDEPPF